MTTSPFFINWTVSHTAPLAKPDCTTCFGIGLSIVRDDADGVPCGCVLREIFRLCHERYLELSDGWHPEAYRQFALDFQIVAKRALSPDTHKLFRSYVIDGRPWRIVAKQMGVNQSTFFFRVAQMKERLGRAYADVRPHALYPTVNYLGKNPNVYGSALAA